jgi:hypothetical protein
MDKYINQVNNHLEDLIKIAIHERSDKGIGVSFLDFSTSNNMDCRYVALGDELFPRNISELYQDRINNVPNSILFFLIYDGNDEVMYEVDLDKNSNYHEKEIEAKNEK